jgi:acetylornithine deacetylase
MTDALIDVPALRDDLDALLRIPSVGGTSAEDEVQEYLAQRWQAEGLDVHTWVDDIDESAPNFPGMEVARTQVTSVTATRPGTGPTILINGHTDVVPPGDVQAWDGDPFVPRWMNGPNGPRVIARGACDMKAGLIAAWSAVRALGSADIPCTITLAPVIGEEDGGVGTYALLQHGTTADMCIIPEPTDLDVIPANAGALTFRLTIHGAAVHASRRTDGVSAITLFHPIAQALEELERRRNANPHPLMERWPLAYPLSIGRLSSGDWASTVPDLLVAEGRFGVALGEDVDAAKAEMESAITSACADHSWLAEHPVEIEWWGGQFASGQTAIDAPVLQSISRAHASVHGSSPEIYGAPYGSDLRLLTQLGGIPTVQYGPGSSAVAHSPNEYVDLDEVVRCAQVLLQFFRTVGT